MLTLKVDKVIDIPIYIYTNVTWYELLNHSEPIFTRGARNLKLRVCTKEVGVQPHRFALCPKADAITFIANPYYCRRIRSFVVASKMMITKSWVILVGQINII